MRVSKKNTDTTNDQELLKQYRETTDTAFLGELYDRYLHLVYGLCLKYLKSREDAEDAVMGIFEQISSSLLSQSVDHFKSWLYIVSKNHCLAVINKKKTESEKTVSLFMDFEDSSSLNDSEALEDDLSALNHCLEKLKAEQKACVSLFYLQKKSYQQVATSTGFELKTVKSAIQNGKRNLKLCIEETLQTNIDG